MGIVGAVGGLALIVGFFRARNGDSLKKLRAFTCWNAALAVDFVILYFMAMCSIEVTQTLLADCQKSTVCDATGGAGLVLFFEAMGAVFINLGSLRYHPPWEALDEETGVARMDPPENLRLRRMRIAIQALWLYAMTLGLWARIELFVFADKYGFDCVGVCDGTTSFALYVTTIFSLVQILVLTGLCAKRTYWEHPLQSEDYVGYICPVCNGTAECGACQGRHVVFAKADAFLAPALTERLPLGKAPVPSS